MSGLSREGYQLRHAVERLAEPRNGTTAQRATATGGSTARPGTVAFGLAGDLLVRATRGTWGTSGAVPSLIERGGAGLTEE